MRVNARRWGGSVEEGGECVGDVRNRHEVERFGFLPFEQDEPLGEIKELQEILRNQCPRDVYYIKRLNGVLFGNLCVTCVSCASSVSPHSRTLARALSASPSSRPLKRNGARDKCSSSLHSSRVEREGEKGRKGQREMEQATATETETERAGGSESARSVHGKQPCQRQKRTGFEEQRTQGAPAMQRQACLLHIHTHTHTHTHTIYQ
jgi:hypothetical protein